MSIAGRVANPIELDANSVWRIPEQVNLKFTDGESHEAYIEKVLRSASDLGSDSYELEGQVRDWVTKYHLSRKRAQLLRGFSFDRKARVLEVGCGCGAITRFLGENFDDVVAVEGNPSRAALARLRTRDMPGVSILSAPFQNVQFRTQFDLIFCIGVFEYSKVFVAGADPHETVLRCFSDNLAPDGALIMAIENQFGLKYFASSPEDHNNIPFDGIEGYPCQDAHKTFGYNELKERLSGFFRNIHFYFPYPDYKMPSCVVSEEAFGQVNLGEMIGRLTALDYPRARTPSFDQRLALMELARNDLLHQFANSFLVVATKGLESRIRFDHLAIIFSDCRRKEYQMATTIENRGEAGIWVRKRRMDRSSVPAGFVSLVEDERRWVRSESIQMQLLKRAKRKRMTFAELFEPCALWMRKIRKESAVKSGHLVVDGRYIDSLWSNSFVENGECVFIDQEWAWNGDIRVNVLVARAVYYLLKEIRGMNVARRELGKGRTRWLAARIGRELGVEISRDDWREFLRVEAEFRHTVIEARKSWKARLVRKLRRAYSWLSGLRPSGLFGNGLTPAVASGKR
jgi:SAM-dependent methyltransferase